MPENVIASTGASSTTNAGGGAINTDKGGAGADNGGSSSAAEPRIGWAGQDDRISDDQGADDSREEDVDLSTDAGDGEFGDENFDDEADSGQKKDVPFKDLIEQLKSQDPAVVKAAEKQMKRDFFENRRYKQIPGCESPEKARELIDKLETFGGVEGIQTKLNGAERMGNALSSGDPAIIEHLAKTSPEGLSKLAPSVLEHFEKINPNGWAHSMATVFMATMNQAPAGGISALAAINALHKAFPEMAKSAEFQRVADVINGVAQIADKAPDNTAKTDDKTKQRETELSQKENVLYRREVSAQVVPEMRKAVNSAIAIVMKGRKLSPEARADFTKDVNLEYSQLAKKDADFQKNANALLAAKDSAGFIKTVKAHMERTMTLAAKRVKKKNDGIAGVSDQDKTQRREEGNSRREAGGGGSTTGTIKTATPSPADVDWQRMRSEFGRDKSDDMFLFQRKYFKKGDKKNVYSY